VTKSKVIHEILDEASLKGCPPVDILIKRLEKRISHTRAREVAGVAEVICESKRMHNGSR
jgi:hypothetical protein